MHAKSPVFSLASSEKQRKAMLNLGLFFSQTNIFEDWEAAVIEESVKRKQSKGRLECSGVCLGKSLPDCSISVVQQSLLSDGVLCVSVSSTRAPEHCRPALGLLHWTV